MPIHNNNSGNDVRKAEVKQPIKCSIPLTIKTCLSPNLSTTGTTSTAVEIKIDIIGKGGVFVNIQTPESWRKICQICCLITIQQRIFQKIE